VIKLGDTNKLKIVRTQDNGFYLDAGESTEIFLPVSQADKSYAIDEWVEVFVYLDTRDRLTATTRTPLGQVNRFSFLKVVQVNEVGAFLYWGLPKDILVPYNEQKTPMREGASYLVYLYIDDKTGRIVASSKIDRFLKSLNDDFKDAQMVDLIVQSPTDLGYKCIVNHTHWGILHKADLFRTLFIGQKLTGYIKCIREDRKIDLCLNPSGYQGIDGIAEKILEKLKDNGGFLAVSDKSAPARIYNLFEVSKQAFKKAVGALYKKRLISLENDGIRLVEKQP
jgi:predicted RNA-binding protein (virulence factor B family)